MGTNVVPSEVVKSGTVAGVSQPTGSKLLAAIYHYATPLDMVFVIVGCLCKAGFGFLQTYVLIIFGEFFVIDGGRSYIEMGEYMLWAMVIFGAASMGVECVGGTCLELAKNRMVAKWKKGYIKGVLRQEVGWYDVNKPQELSTRMGESLVLIEKGLGSGTMGLISMGLGQLVSGLVIGFIFKWDLALVTLGTSAITFVPAAVYSMAALDKKTKMLADAYGEAGGVASETLSGLRTVVSLGLEPASLSRYERCLRGAERAVIATTKKLHLSLSMFDASMYFILGAGADYLLLTTYYLAPSTNAFERASKRAPAAGSVTRPRSVASSCQHSA